jgi:hypothetical protein
MSRIANADSSRRALPSRPQPSKLYNKVALVNKPFRKIAKTIISQTSGNFYRADLQHGEAACLALWHLRLHAGSCAMQKESGAVQRERCCAESWVPGAVPCRELAGAGCWVQGAVSCTELGGQELGACRGSCRAGGYAVPIAVPYSRAA